MSAVAAGFGAALTHRRRVSGEPRARQSAEQEFDGIKAEARKAIEEAIWIYNHRRLHEKLGYKTPAAFRADWKEAS